MNWAFEFRPQAARALKKFDANTRALLVGYLETRVAPSVDPRTMGKALTGPLAGLWRYRVGDYRIVCQVDKNSRRIVVVGIGHRSDVYG